MPITYKFSMAWPSSRFMQCRPIRHSTSENSSRPAKPSTYGAASAAVTDPWAVNRPISAATISGAM